MINDNMKKLFDIFDSAGYDLRIVGGAVRDYLLGEEPKDIDFCTDALPEEMEFFAKAKGLTFIPTGIDHGTVTLGVDGEMFEVTTLRVDVETDGRHAEVAFTRSFEDDAARRDLTINAMSMDRDGNIYDYFDGQEDLKNRQIRFVGIPTERVQEDYLRILRFFRFAARFGGIEKSIDQVTVITEIQCLIGLRRISVERYWMEMQKLLVAPYADEVINCMFYTGVLQTLGLDKPWIPSRAKAGAIGSLSTMLRPDTLNKFLSTWKLSADEQKELRFLVSKQSNGLIFSFNEIEDMLVDGIPVEWVVSALYIAGEWNLVSYARDWNVPVFPVQGQDLLDAGMLPGPEVGNKLREMRQRWKNSRFEATKEQLLSEA